MKSDYYHDHMDKADKAKKAKNRLSREEMEIESAFEEMMGQFAEGETNEAQDGQVGTMTLFVTDQDGGEHEVEVEVEIKNGKPEINPKSLPGPEDQLYWDDADIEQQAMDAMRDGDIEFDEGADEDDDTMDVKIDPKTGTMAKADAPEEKKEKTQTPISEFILSYFDKETGQFPKGETAVLTMIEKDYGEQFIDPAKSFIEKVTARFEEHQMRTQPQQMETDDEEFDRVRQLAGLR